MSLSQKSGQIKKFNPADAETIDLRTIYTSDRSDFENRVQFKDNTYILQSLGYSDTLPLRPANDELAKAPAVKYRQFYDNPVTPRQRKEWVKIYGNRNTSAIVPRGKVVVDIDIPNLPAGYGLPLTPITQTRKGNHYHFLDPDQAIPLKGELVINGRRYGDILPHSAPPPVMPGSYINGHLYSWNVAPIGAKNGAPESEYAPLPAWVIDSWKESKNEPAPRKEPAAFSMMPRTEQGKVDVLSTINPIYIVSCTQTVDFHPDHVLSFASNPVYLKKVLEFLGITGKGCENGTAFLCPMHEERHPSASLYRFEDGTIRFRDWHKREGVEWFSLPELYVSRLIGRAFNFKAEDFKGISHLIWQVRLLIDAGVLRCAPPNIPTLPDADKNTREIASSLAYLFACHWLFQPGKPCAFSYRFARLWCGKSDKAIAEGIGNLLKGKHPAIEIVGSATFGGRETNLFLPVFRD